MDNRVGMATYLYLKGVSGKMLLSGGAKVKGSLEAILMKKTAFEFKVKEEDLILEEESTTSRSNARYSMKIAKEKGFKSVLVVSDWVQLRYAVPPFQNLGIEYGIKVYWASVDYKIIQKENLITYPTLEEFKRVEALSSEDVIGPRIFRPSKKVRRP